MFIYKGNRNSKNKKMGLKIIKLTKEYIKIFYT